MTPYTTITKQEILVRLVASLLLVVIASVFWVTARMLDTPVSPEWLYGISSGLIVLGIAGIWVSYFAEKQAGKNITRRVDSRFSILTSCFDAGIYNLYKTRHDPALRETLLTEMQKTRDEIRILAVAAREFLHEGQEGEDFAYHIMRSLAQDKRMRLLLLHPWCEQAVSRGLWEDPQHSTFERYRDTRLYQDVTRSCDTLVEWANATSNFLVRLYKVMPSCFLILTDDVMFVEQYHFGTGGRASGKVPVWEVHKGSRLYEQFEGHFEHVWETAEPFLLCSDLAKSLRGPSEKERELFEATIEFARPDLPATEPSKGVGKQQSIEQVAPPAPE